MKGNKINKIVLKNNYYLYQRKKIIFMIFMIYILF